MKISQYFHQANTLYHEHQKESQNQEDDTQQHKIRLKLIKSSFWVNI